MICILNYDMGNVGSIGNMFKRLGISAVVSRDPGVISKADQLILPGVGSFDEGMKNLMKLGLREVLDERVLGARVPILGICLGMQLMTKSSEEGVEPGLGWIDAKTVHFGRERQPLQEELRLPHIGWNFVDQEQPHELLRELPEDPRFYFVHTYRVVCDRSADVVLSSEYAGTPFTAAFAKDNIFGIQGHPEKSHRFGMKMFTNFARWSPSHNEDTRRYA